MAARDESFGLIEAVTDEQILSAQACWPARGRLRRAGVRGRGGRACWSERDRGELPSGLQIVVTVTGHGLKDIDTALWAAGPVHAAWSADLLAIADGRGLLN